MDVRPHVRPGDVRDLHARPSPPDRARPHRRLDATVPDLAPQLAVIVGVFAFEMMTWRYWRLVLPQSLATRLAISLPWVLAWAVRRARVEGRSLVRAAAGHLMLLVASPTGPVGGRPYTQARKADLRVTSSVWRRPVKPPARAIVGNLVWATDGGVWAVWQRHALPARAHRPPDKLAVHARLRGLCSASPAQSMLLSVCERLDPVNLVTDMLTASTRPRTTPGSTSAPPRATGWRRWRSTSVATTWRRSCPTPGARCSTCSGGRRARSTAVRGRPQPRPDERARVTTAPGARDRGAAGGQRADHGGATAGEVCWLYARSLRREAGEPAFDDGSGSRRRHRATPADGPIPAWVLAQLTDAVVKEGGYKGDPDRPRHRRYVRIDGPGGTSYQTVLAMADMPHFFAYPDGGGEWLYQADQVGFPVDWCVRIKAVPNADAQAKVRRKHRDLIGQVDEYDGEVSGAPPQLAAAIQAIDQERAQLGANPMEPELHVTVLMSIAADNLAELEDKSAALVAMFEPQEYALARPTGGQAALLRSMLPGTAAAPVVATTRSSC